MIAAIYGRYSSEGQREASIADQARNCERRAEREGWQIAHRYADKGISGSQDATGRDGYRAMLEAAKARRFQVLLVDDLSRLSRDEAELILVRRKLQYWGVRLIGVSDGFDSEAKGHKIQATVRGLMNEMYLDDLREKTHRGLTGQALKGFNCGGRTYGYRHVPIYHETDKDPFGQPRIVAVKREVDPDQARWVLQICQWYAEGQSPRDIAGRLNQLRVPAPGAAYRRKQRPSYYGTWSASVLHGDPKAGTGLLHNPLYIGRFTWNRRQWVRDPETKRKVPKLRPESEWIVTERPELRIVPQDLWERVQARTPGQQQTPGRKPKYLFSGLLKCGASTPDGECGANFVMSDYYRYGCGAALNRQACCNHLRVSRDKVETKLLAGIKQDLFTPEAMDLFIKETTRLLAERRRAQRPDLAATQRRLAKIEQEIANIMTAIKAGILTPTTKTELEQAEAERARLQEGLQAETKALDKVITLLPQAPARYRAWVENLGNLPGHHVAEAREQIRTLVGEIKLVPTAEGYLEAELTGSYPGLLKLAVGTGVKQYGCGGRI